MLTRIFVAALALLSLQGTQAPRYSSRIMIYDLRTKTSTLVHQADAVWEAPNWSRDGAFLLSNSGGRLSRIAASGVKAASN